MLKRPFAQNINPSLAWKVSKPETILSENGRP